MLDGFDDRSAYAQTIIAFTSGPDDVVHIFDGRTDGTIVAPRGPLDFGWDPIFQPDEGEGKTYAEMPKDFKNQISHRSRSMEKFRAFLVKESDDAKDEKQATKKMSIAA
jgi:inosine triphosphate pyrophosphatase